MSAIYMNPPSCRHCHETPWGDACKRCGAGNYSNAPNDHVAQCWAMAAEYIRLKRDLQEFVDRT